MIIGHDKLLELFPSFEEDIKENGIDLRIGKVEHTVNKQKRIGCINGEKTYRRPMKCEHLMMFTNSIHTITTLSLWIDLLGFLMVTVNSTLSVPLLQDVD